MRIKFFIAVFILLSVCAQAQHKSLEQKIIDTVFNLKEVKERAQYVEKASKGKRHLSVAFYSKPSKDEPYYWVKAWEDNGGSYVTHFDFYVYPKTLTIKFYDVENDTAISLQEWRSRRKK